jgi:hypothetical protein
MFNKIRDFRNVVRELNEALAQAHARLAEAADDNRRLRAEHDVNSQTLARLQKELHTMQIRPR